MALLSYAIAALASRSGLLALPLRAYERLCRPPHSLGTPSSLIDFASTRFALRAEPSAEAGEASAEAARAAAQARSGRRAFREGGRSIGAGLDAPRRNLFLSCGAESPKV